VLIKLSVGNISKASAMFDVEGMTLESLYKIVFQFIIGA
jgi:hypothetical protein